MFRVITDYQDNLVLDFIDYTLDVDHPNYSVIECKVRDATYSAALRVTARLLNKSTGEIKESNVFMGRFPADDRKRHIRYQRC